MSRPETITRENFEAFPCEERGGWTLVQLRAFAKSLSLVTSGNKPELCDRIRGEIRLEGVVTQDLLQIAERVDAGLSAAGPAVGPGGVALEATPAPEPAPAATPKGRPAKGRAAKRAGPLAQSVGPGSLQGLPPGYRMSFGELRAFVNPAAVLPVKPPRKKAVRAPRAPRAPRSPRGPKKSRRRKGGAAELAAPPEEAAPEPAQGAAEVVTELAAPAEGEPAEGEGEPAEDEGELAESGQEQR